MPADFDTIVNLAKKRGFVFQSSEIYGGLRSAYDYGPLGVAVLRNVKEQWWRSMVRLRDDIVGLDSAIIQSPRVWEASGHVASFTDPLVECTNCHNRHRLDKLEDQDQCPSCGMRGTFTDPKQFNLMFRTHMGPVEGEGNLVYLRPETAQGIFINYENVRRTSRLRLPFGIAQIGKAFRNEITPGQFVFRTREFEQMEMEFFCRPDESQQWFEYWQQERMRWFTDLGLTPERLRLRPHDADELSHYSSGTSDIEYLFPWDWDELEGHRQPHRLRPEGARRRQWRGPHLLRRRHRRALLPLRCRARRRRHPHHVRLPHRRLHRGRGRWGEAHRAPPRPPSRPGEGGGAPAVEEGRADRGDAAGRRFAAPAVGHRGGRDAGDRAPLPPPGRDRHARSASPSTSTRSTTTR